MPELVTVGVGIGIGIAIAIRVRRPTAIATAILIPIPRFDVFRPIFKPSKAQHVIGTSIRDRKGKSIAQVTGAIGPYLIPLEERSSG